MNPDSILPDPYAAEDAVQAAQRRLEDYVRIYYNPAARDPITVVRIDSSGETIDIYSPHDIRNPEASGSNNDNPLSPHEHKVLLDLLNELARIRDVG